MQVRIALHLSAVAAALLFTAAACTTGEDGAHASTVRDSAGVRIVENVAPAWAPQDAWRLAAEPEVDVGTLEGEPAHMLEQPSGVVLLPDGSFVVADMRASDLRWFDGQGRHIRTVGGRGAGPGEFQFLTGLLPVAADTLAAVDATLRRTTLLTAEGQVVGIVGLAPRGRLADGRWIHATASRLPGERRAGRVQVDLAVLASLEGDGPADTLAIVPGGDMLFIEQDMGRGMQVVGMPLPYGVSTHLKPWGDAIIMTDGSAYQLTRLDGSGAIRQIMRRSLARTPITEEVRARYRAAELERVPEELRPTLERRHEQLIFPDSFPAWQSLHMDRNGHAWARHYTLPEDAAQTWSVFDPDGRWLGEVQMPSDFTVMDIAHGRVAGIRLDELDVPHVLIYHLTTGNRR